VIVADTGGIIALLDRDDRHHASVRALLRESPRWIVPWAILPEVDYIATTRLGAPVAKAFLDDVREGHFTADGNIARDLGRAAQLLETYASLGLGLVDAVVMAQAERHRARVIVTTDGRHFRSVRLQLKPPPRLVPIDS
jgi:predicted nucleic acid-binding protein